MTKVTCKIMKSNGEETNMREIRDESGQLITYAEKRTMQDYIDECLHGENECAELLAKYERVRDGKDAILWFDNETQEIFISY